MPYIDTLSAEAGSYRVGCGPVNFLKKDVVPRVQERFGTNQTGKELEHISVSGTTECHGKTVHPLTC